MNIKKTTILTLVLVFLIGFNTVSYALEDGAYLIGRSTSYVNPVTNKTEDGGTNVELGNSMISNLVEKKLLIEKKGDEYYLTIGLGLASNISNVRMYKMDEKGKFTELDYKITGTSQGKSDKINHYRIKIDSLDTYISPRLFVGPMERDVQFFIHLDESDVEIGTGIYKNEMAKINKEAKIEKKEKKKEEVKKDEPVVEEKVVKKEKVGEVTKDSLMKESKGLSGEKSKPKGKSKGIGVTTVLLVTLPIIILLLVGIIYVKKSKK